jgi:predicted metal-dependent hydrolase
VTKHYVEHKEAARQLICARLAQFNEHYQYEWKRVAIRNTKRSWGSCSSLKNLNFSYKLLLLPDDLCDYIVVHELCHLQELNHGPRFWALVAETIPDYKERIKRLKAIERQGASVRTLETIKNAAQT